MRKFFKAVAFVTIFSVLTRTIGFFLRIYLSRVMGAETLGAYQVSMSIFGVLMTLVTSGLPLVVSRNVAYFEQKNANMQHKNITAGLIIAIALSTILCVILYAFPNILQIFITSEESISMILILLPALIASAIYSILRSGLWGRKYFFTISFTEFFEQVVRIILCIILFNIPLSLSVGQKSALSLTLSCVASAILVLILYFVFGGRLKSPKDNLLPILKTSTPITLVRTISSVVGSLIAIIIPHQLTKFGYSESEALAQFGMFMGMTMPILMIPNTFTSSIAVALVPEISGYTNNIDKYKGNIDGLSNKITSAIKTVILISFILMASFISLGKPICKFLFNNSQAGVYLSASAVLMLPIGLNQICTSMLNAVGLEIKALGNYAIGVIGLFLAIFILPQYIGTYSIVVGLGLMHLLTCILSLRMLKRRKLINWTINKPIFLCVIICAIVSLIGCFAYNLLIKFMNYIIALIIIGVLTVGCTVLLMAVFNLVNMQILMVKFTKRKKYTKKSVTNNQIINKVA